MTGTPLAHLFALSSAVLFAGCGLLLDLDGDREDDPAIADGATAGDGGSASGDASSGLVDGSRGRMDGSAATDAASGRDGAGVGDGASVAVDGAVPRIDAGPCVDDTREDDDDLSQAMASGPVTEVVPGLVVFDGMSCPGDDDVVYAYGDCCDDAQGATVMFDPAHGRVSLTVLGEDGTPWPRGAREPTPGYLELLMTGTGGYFYVVVRNESGAPVPYTLTVYAPVYVSL